MDHRIVPDHRIVSPEEWLDARRALLAKEKDLLRERDTLRRLTRELPWVKVEKTYVFEGPKGKQTLADLFEGRSQLIVKHFMMAPGWKEGCLGCSFGADQVDGSVVHLINHDVMYVAVSRAPSRDRRLPQAHGLEIQVGVVQRQRLQLRLQRLLQRRGQGAWQGLLQL